MKLKYLLPISIVASATAIVTPLVSCKYTSDSTIKLQFNEDANQFECENFEIKENETYKFLVDIADIQTQEIISAGTELRFEAKDQSSSGIKLNENSFKVTCDGTDVTESCKIDESSKIVFISSKDWTGHEQFVITCSWGSNSTGSTLIARLK